MGGHGVRATAAGAGLDDELLRIRSYKLFSKSIFKQMDQSITDKAYYAAIRKFIKPYGAKAQEKFDREVESSLTDGNVLTYQDVFYLTYLTAFATDNLLLTQVYNAPFIYAQVDGQDHWCEGYRCNETYAEREKGYYTFYDPWGDRTRCGDEFRAISLYFVLTQTSQWSGAALYDIKNDRNVKMFSANCPNDIAVRMLGRLYETTKPVQWEEDGAFDNVLRDAANRREAILTSSSEYPEGKTYYISTDGDDNNDGLSEETPWKSLQCSGGVHGAGSVILLKRGDVWKGEHLSVYEGVTVSAYGTGPKPMIYGDAEEPGDPANWELCKNISTGSVKIWKYRKDLYDVGGIIFNGGSSYAVRKFGWWRDSKWVDPENVTKELTPSYALKEDLTFISLPDLTGLSYPIKMGNINPRKGPVYLRCDSGNPAEIFNEIHFEQSGGDNGCPIWCLENSTVDNIAVRYFGELAITSDFTDEETQGMSLPGVTVRNCEIGFGGNVYLEFPSEEPEIFASSTGDGIYGICNGAVIQNNYIHDVDCVAIRVENSGQMLDRVIDKPMIVKGNLCERNGSGIWIESVGGNISYEELSIIDNMVLENGRGWVHGGGCGNVGISTDDLAENACEKVIIKNNVIYDTPYTVYDCVGKNLKESGNRFYMCTYTCNTLISGNLIYVLDRDNKTATVTGTAYSGLKSIMIPKKVKDGKTKYTVTGIAACAFQGEQELKTIDIKTKTLTTAGKKAFDGLPSNTVIKVPKSKKTQYSSLFKGSGFNGTVK